MGWGMIPVPSHFCSSSSTTSDVFCRKLPLKNGNAEFSVPAMEQARQQIMLWAGAVLK
jgi:hypothetical protein